MQHLFQRALTLSILVLASLGGMGCASGPKEVGSPVLRLVLVDNRTDTSMSIVSDSWLSARGIPGATLEERRVEFASITRSASDATTKVLDDARFQQVVSYMRSDLNWDQHATEGGSESSLGLYTSAILLEERGLPSVFGSMGSLPPAAIKDYAACKRLVFEVFNEIYTLQSVNDLGGFQEGAARR